MRMIEDECESPIHLWWRDKENRFARAVWLMGGNKTRIRPQMYGTVCKRLCSKFPHLTHSTNFITLVTSFSPKPISRARITATAELAMSSTKWQCEKQAFDNDIALIRREGRYDAFQGIQFQTFISTMILFAYLPIFSVSPNPWAYRLTLQFIA